MLGDLFEGIGVRPNPARLHRAVYPQEARIWLLTELVRQVFFVPGNTVVSLADFCKLSTAAGQWVSGLLVVLCRLMGCSFFGTISWRRSVVEGAIRIDQHRSQVAYSEANHRIKKKIVPQQ